MVTGPTPGNASNLKSSIYRIVRYQYLSLFFYLFYLKVNNRCKIDDYLRLRLLRPGLFWPGTLQRINRFLKLLLFLRLEEVPTRLRPSTFGVWPLTLPALVSEPCVGIVNRLVVGIYVFVY